MGSRKKSVDPFWKLLTLDPDEIDYEIQRICTKHRHLALSLHYNDMADPHLYRRKEKVRDKLNRSFPGSHTSNRKTSFVIRTQPPETGRARKISHRSAARRHRDGSKDNATRCHSPIPQVSKSRISERKKRKQKRKCKLDTKSALPRQKRTPKSRENDARMETVLPSPLTLQELEAELATAKPFVYAHHIPKAKDTKIDASRIFSNIHYKLARSRGQGHAVDDCDVTVVRVDKHDAFGSKVLSDPELYEGSSCCDTALLLHRSKATTLTPKQWPNCDDEQSSCDTATLLRPQMDSKPLPNGVPALHSRIPRLQQKPTVYSPSPWPNDNGNTLPEVKQAEATSTEVASACFTSGTAVPKQVNRSTSADLTPDRRSINGDCSRTHVTDRTLEGNRGEGFASDVSSIGASTSSSWTLDTADILRAGGWPDLNQDPRITKPLNRANSRDMPYVRYINPNSLDAEIEESLKSKDFEDRHANVNRTLTKDKAKHNEPAERHGKPRNYYQGNTEQYRRPRDRSPDKVSSDIVQHRTPLASCRDKASAESDAKERKGENGEVEKTNTRQPVAKEFRPPDPNDPFWRLISLSTDDLERKVKAKLEAPNQSDTTSQANQTEVSVSSIDTLGLEVKSKLGEAPEASQSGVRNQGNSQQTDFHLGKNSQGYNTKALESQTPSVDTLSVSISTDMDNSEASKRHSQAQETANESQNDVLNESFHSDSTLELLDPNLSWVDFEDSANGNVDDNMGQKTNASQMKALSGAYRPSDSVHTNTRYRGDKREDNPPNDTIIQRYNHHGNGHPSADTISRYNHQDNNRGHYPPEDHTPKYSHHDNRGNNAPNDTTPRYNHTSDPVRSHFICRPGVTRSSNGIASDSISDFSSASGPGATGGRSKGKNWQPSSTTMSPMKEANLRNNPDFTGRNHKEDVINRFFDQLHMSTDEIDGDLDLDTSSSSEIIDDVIEQPSLLSSSLSLSTDVSSGCRQIIEKVKATRHREQQLKRDTQRLKTASSSKHKSRREYSRNHQPANHERQSTFSDESITSRDYTSFQSSRSQIDSPGFYGNGSSVPIEQTTPRSGDASTKVRTRQHANRGTRDVTRSVTSSGSLRSDVQDQYANVKFRWPKTVATKANVVYLATSFLKIPASMHWSRKKEIFESEHMNAPTGYHHGNIKIGDRIYPLAPFCIKGYMFEVELETLDGGQLSWRATQGDSTTQSSRHTSYY